MNSTLATPLGFCRAEILVPASTPLLASLGIAVATFIAMLLCYVRSERRLQKTFYGVVDEMEDTDACQYSEVKVIHTIDADLLPQKSQVKVLVRRRRARIPRTPAPARATADVQFDADENGTEVLEAVDRFLTEAWHRTCCADETFDASRELSLPNEVALAEQVLAVFRQSLEALLPDTSCVCHCKLARNDAWLVDGQTALEEQDADLALMLKIDILTPIGLLLLGYKVNRVHPRASSVPAFSLRVATTQQTYSSTPLRTQGSTEVLKSDRTNRSALHPVESKSKESA